MAKFDAEKEVAAIKDLMRANGWTIPGDEPPAEPEAEAAPADGE